MKIPRAVENPRPKEIVHRRSAKKKQTKKNVYKLHRDSVKTEYNSKNNSN